MTDPKKGDSGRAERLRAALRENLRKRKVQAKGRSAQDNDAETGPAARETRVSRNSAGFAPDKSKG